jgi:GT2 family glycosyltransferase
MAKLDIKVLSTSLLSSKPIYKVVVDNSPVSNSREIFESYGWTYFHDPKNPGFGASHNFIFNNFSHLAEYHLILNPDISFEGKIISDLIYFLSNNPESGCVMPKVFYPNGELQRLAKLLPSPIDWIIRRMPFKGLKNIINRRLELHNANYESGVFKVPFVSGCFLMFKTSVIIKIGFFDERFFMYTEDTDLSRRLWISRCFAYYYGDVSVVHEYKKESSTNLNLFKIHVISAIKYFNKWGWFDEERKIINRECIEQFQ